MKKIKFLFLFLSFTTVSVFSQETTLSTNNSPNLKFLVGAGIEFGGDSVAQIFFQNGSDQSVNAGQGLAVSVGGELSFPSLEKFSLRATLGFKYVTTKATNYHITLTRIPLEFSANYMVTKSIRLAAGFASHQNIKFNSDGLGANETFKGGFGPKLEIAYKWIGLSYTIMNYSDSLNNSYNANAFGITLSTTDIF